MKVLGKSIVILATLYLGFRYLGDFSSRQGLVLAFAALLGYGLYRSLNRQVQIENVFSPFRVWIEPNWYELLSDFKLIGSVEEWRRLCEEGEKVPSSEYSVFRSGFSFTVIKPPSEYGPLPGLTSWDNRKIFVSQVWFSESIVKLNDEAVLPTLREEHPFFKHPRWAQLPEIYVHAGLDGYELGLEVQHDWWKHLCERGEIGELAKIKTRIAGATARLEVAKLPYSEFAIYYEEPDRPPLTHPPIFQKRREQKQGEAMNRQLEENGWKREIKLKDDIKITDPWFQKESVGQRVHIVWRVKHKYFAVTSVNI